MRIWRASGRCSDIELHGGLLAVGDWGCIFVKNDVSAWGVGIGVGLLCKTTFLRGAWRMGVHFCEMRRVFVGLGGWGCTFVKDDVSARGLADGGALCVGKHVPAWGGGQRDVSPCSTGVYSLELSCAPLHFL